MYSKVDFFDWTARNLREHPAETVKTVAVIAVQPPLGLLKRSLSCAAGLEHGAWVESSSALRNPAIFCRGVVVVKIGTNPRPVSTTDTTTPAKAATVPPTAHQATLAAAPPAEAQPARTLSWFERLTYAAVVGASLALPLSAAQAQDTKPDAGPKSTPQRLLLQERSGKDVVALTRGALHLDLNNLYHGVVTQLRSVYDKNGWAQHPDIEKQAQRFVDAAIGRLVANWDPQEQAALHRVMNTLDQLAGGDRVFNHGDNLAIVQALLADKGGILKMAHQEIDQRIGIGNKIAHRLVDNAYTPTRHAQSTGHAGPFQRMRDHRREKIEGLAQQAMFQQLQGTLAKLGVNPQTGNHIDRVSRNLKIDDVVSMEGDLRLLEGRLTSMTATRLPAGRVGAVLEQLKDILQKNVDVSQPPLRNGVPSPKSLDAITKTLLDALDGLTIHDLSVDLQKAFKTIPQAVRPGDRAPKPTAP